MKFLSNPLFKNILSAIVVAVFGFILLNLTFLFDFFYQSIIDLVVGLFTSVDFNMAWYLFPLLKHFSFVIIIGLISWFVFKSDLKVIYKAIYMTVPTATVLITIGMFLYQWPVLVYTIGSLLCGSTLYYFYKTKQPWLYYYTIILMSIILAIFTAMGGEI